MHIDDQGDGPDLVLLHGWAMHAGIFAPLTRALAPHFRLHLVDLPGHGSSRDDARAIRSRRHARAASPLRRRARSGSAGRSADSSRCARRSTRPANVRGLVLIASSPRFVAGDDWPLGVAANVLAEFSAGLAHDYRGTIERFLALETMGSDHARSELRELKAQVFARGEPAAAALEEGLHMLETADLRAELARIAVPSLWIAGRRDRLINPAAMQWAASARGGRYLECNSGHAPFLAHADALARGDLSNSPRSCRHERRPRRAPCSPRLRPRRVDLRSARGAAGRSRRAPARTAGWRRVCNPHACSMPAAVPAAAQPRCARGSRKRTSSRSISRCRCCARPRAHVGQPPAFARVAADAQALPFADASIDLVYSNLCLQWCDDPGLALAEFARVLRAGWAASVHDLRTGDAVMSCAAAFAAADAAPHVSRFVDMHDIGDALLTTGFRDPVLEREDFTLTYADALTLMRELRAIGATNADAKRQRTLTGKAHLAARRRRLRAVPPRRACCRRPTKSSMRRRSHPSPASRDARAAAARSRAFRSNACADRGDDAPLDARCRAHRARVGAVLHRDVRAQSRDGECRRTLGVVGAHCAICLRCRCSRCVLPWRGGFAPVWRALRAHPRVWLAWSGVGFALFCVCLTWAAAYAPAWLVAGTFQLTVIAGMLLAPLIYDDARARLPRGALALGVAIVARRRADAAQPFSRTSRSERVARARQRDLRCVSLSARQPQDPAAS